MGTALLLYPSGRRVPGPAPRGPPGQASPAPPLAPPLPVGPESPRPRLSWAARVGFSRAAPAASVGRGRAGYANRSRSTSFAWGNIVPALARQGHEGEI